MTAEAASPRKPPWLPVFVETDKLGVWSRAWIHALFCLAQCVALGKLPRASGPVQWEQSAVLAVRVAE